MAQRVSTNMYSNFTYTLNHGYWGVFAQDQWRVTPKLTFNYGLRWDVETGLGSVIDADYRAYQPRVGLAWSPNSKTVIRSGFGIFFDRNNMTFFFTTGNQKTLPGYFCANGATPANCTAATPGVTVPMINSNAATGGWQLSAQPGFPGTPSLPCGVFDLPASACPPQQGGTLSFAALTAIGILAGAPYPSVTLTGPCTLVGGAPTGACGVGAGGIQKNGRLPYAEQASPEIDRQIGRGFSLNVAYLFVAAHKLVRGNNINVPCPNGTTKASNPTVAQGILNTDGSLTACTGTPTLVQPFGLGPIFGTLANPAGLEFGVPSASNPAPTISGGLLDYNNNVANSSYNGLTVSAIEHWGKILNLTANYTYSHTIDNSRNFTTFINLPPNQFDYSSERANSNQDVRNHLVTNFTVTAPDDSILRHFAFSSIITLQSGRPFTLFPGENVFGDVAGLSTDRVGGAPIKGTCTNVTNCNTTIGRNTYTGDPLYALQDLQNIPIFSSFAKNLKLDLAVDAFNALNRGNVDEVTSVYGSPVFCGATPAVPRHYNDALTQSIEQGSGKRILLHAARAGAAASGDCGQPIPDGPRLD